MLPPLRSAAPREETDDDAPQETITFRWFILILALSMSSCVSGVVFGWSALVARRGAET